MISWKKNLTSSIGKKFVTGITGLLLVSFVIVHLIGNLLLYAGPDAFNSYAYFLEHRLIHGWAVYVADAMLFLFFGAHAVAGISVWQKKRLARPQPYYQAGNAGGASRKSFASRTMIVSGLVILVFVILHVRMFKFGPTATVVVDGIEMRDLYTLVVSTFKVWWISFAYMAVMVLLGLHLRHGIWSAFQSVGATSPRYQPVIYVGGVTLSILIGLGFFLLPLVILFFYENPALSMGGI